MRNIKTREGMEFWDKICSLKHYGFLHSQDGKRVVKSEGIGNWIDKHEAQKIVDQAQSEINQFRAERDALQMRLNAADQRIDELTQARDGERLNLIAYGRSNGLDEASTVCTHMAHDAYFPAGSRFRHFTPKAQKTLGDLLIKAANAIASLPDGPYDRFKTSQLKKAGTSAVA